MKRRAPAGLDRLPGQVQQVERTTKPERVIRIRHRHQQRGNTQRRAQHIHDETQRHTAE